MAVFDPNAADFMQQLDYTLFLGTTGVYKAVGKSKFPHPSATRLISELLKNLNDAECLQVLSHIFASAMSNDSVDTRAAFVMYAAMLSSNRAAVRSVALKAFRHLRSSRSMFEVLHYTLNMRGWGRGLRRAVLEWYKDRVTFLDEFIQDLITAPRYGSWTHASVLDLVHLTSTDSPMLAALCQFMRVGTVRDDVFTPSQVDTLTNFNIARADPSAFTLSDVTLALLHSRLQLSVLHPARLREMPIWISSLQHMSITELFRAASPMGKLGMGYGTESLRILVAEIQSVTAQLRRTGAAPTEFRLLSGSKACGRVSDSVYANPAQIYAMKYRYGLGRPGSTRFRTDSSWDVQLEVLDAADRAIHAAASLMPPMPDNLRIYTNLIARTSQYNASVACMGHSPSVMALSSLVWSLAVASRSRSIHIASVGVQVRRLRSADIQEVHSLHSVYNEVNRNVRISGDTLDIGRVIHDDTMGPLAPGRPEFLPRHMLLVFFTRQWTSTLYATPRDFLDAYFAATGIRLKLFILVMDTTTIPPMSHDSRGDLMYASGIAPELLPVIYRFFS